VSGHPKIEMVRSYKTSVHIWTTRRYIPEDGNIHDYRCENLKSYIIILMAERLDRSGYTNAPDNVGYYDPVTHQEIRYWCGT
jgi:hypothetical protein